MRACRQTPNARAGLRERPAALARASGRPAVSVGREEARTSAGDERPRAGQGAKARPRWRQRGGGHGGRHPLRNVLRRTRRTAARRKWMALTCGARPPARGAVGGRARAGEAWARARVEACAAQILGAVARRRPCRDGFVLCAGGDATPSKRDPRGGSRGGALRGDTGGDGSGASGGPSRRGRPERRAATDARCTLKRTRASRTEPHQGSGVSSPARGAPPVREVGKLDE